LPREFDTPRYTRAADRILDGRFDVFALEDASLGFPPRWNVDPKTGIEAPLDFGFGLDYRDARRVGDISISGRSTATWSWSLWPRRGISPQLSAMPSVPGRSSIPGSLPVRIRWASTGAQASSMPSASSIGPSPGSSWGQMAPRSLPAQRDRPSVPAGSKASTGTATSSPGTGHDTPRPTII